MIVDEAAISGTPNLDTAVAYVLGRGGSVRLVGDNQQLASVSAGGVVRDIAETVGAVTLTEIMRFTDPAEGAASLATGLGTRPGSASTSTTTESGSATPPPSWTRPTPGGPPTKRPDSTR